MLFLDSENELLTFCSYYGVKVDCSTKSIKFDRDSFVISKPTVSHKKNLKETNSTNSINNILLRICFYKDAVASRAFRRDQAENMHRRHSSFKILFKQVKRYVVFE